jgi:hypothetical protein
MYGEPLSEIVGWALKDMGISTYSGANALDSYYKYVEVLWGKFFTSEPNNKYLVLQNANYDTIVQRMLNLLPGHVPEKLKSLIEKAAASSTGYVHTGVDDFGKLFYHENGKNFERSEFVILKIFKSSTQLEIIPTYMSVQGKKEETRFLFFNNSYSQSILELKSEKFILTEYDIKNIIDNVRNVKGKWGSKREKKSDMFSLPNEFSLITKDDVEKVMDNIRKFKEKFKVQF